jgi:hypothetical protein
MKTLYIENGVNHTYYISCSKEHYSYCYMEDISFRVNLDHYGRNFDTFSIKIDRKLNQITYVDIMDYIKKHLPELML